MNKLFTNIATAFVGISMAIGVGVAIGSGSDKVVPVFADSKVYNASGSSSGNYKLVLSTDSKDYWTTNAGSNETASPSRGLAWSKKAATLTYTPNFDVTGLTLTGSSNSAGQAITYKIGTGSSTSVGSMTKANNKDYIFSNFSCSSGSQITISITAGSKSTWVKSITLTYSATPSTPTTIQSVTISGGSSSVTSASVGDKANLTASATNATGEGTSTFTWASSNTNVATVTSQGQVTYVGNGSTNITATSNYPASATGSNVGTLSVTVSNLKGSEINPFSVTEAWNIANALTSGTNNGHLVYVSGVITGDPSVNADNGRGNFNITDSNKTIYAYSINGCEGTDTTKSNYIADGYSVVVAGAIINYGGTLEVGYASGFTTALVSSTAPSLPEITALALDTSNVTTQFDLNSEFNYTGLVVTGTVDGVSGTAIPSGDYSVSTPDMTSQGQKTVKVTYTGTSYDHASTISASYNINVVIPSPDDTIDLIDDIGTVVYTQESHEKIVAARSSYNALPAESQALVTNYSDLTAAESDFDELILTAVDNVETLISNIGTVSLSSESAIQTAEAAYDALLDGNLGKSLVSNHETLTAARAAYDQLVDDREAADSVEALITALPAPSSISDYSYHSQIAAARSAFNALNTSAQGMVSNLQKLIDCETEDAKYAPSVQGTYAKVTDLSQLSSGATVIITNGDGTFAMGEQKSNNRGTATGAASAGGSITISSDSTDIQVFTIESYSTQTDTIVAFKTVNSLADVSGYLYAASSSSNCLKTQSSVDANAKFYVTLSSGSFTVSADDSSNRHIMKYNDSSNLFSCYSSGQKAVAIYVKGGVSTYTVTYDGNGSDGGTKPVDSTSYNSGDTVTVLDNTFTKTGYTFVSWNTAQDGSGSSYEKDEQFTITANVTLYAIWEEGGGGGSATAVRCYHLVTSTKDLVVGAKYIITNNVDTGTGFFAVGTQKSNNRGGESITSQKTGVAQVSSSAVEVITLGGTNDAWTLGVNGGYLYASSSSSNQLKTEESLDANNNGLWAITISDGIASIVAQGTNSRATMRYNYNNGSPLFACYENSSKQSDIYLYRLDFGETLLANVTCDGAGSHSLPDGYTWNTDLQGVYNDLPAAEKTTLASASSAGLERYDYIVGKYNPTGETDSSKTNYVHFIAGRTVTPRSSSGIVLLTVLGKNTTNTSIIVIVTVGIAAIAIGGYFLLRKKKED